MSGAGYENLIIPGEIIRDVSATIVNGGNQNLDTFQDYGMIGMDFFIHNRGAANLTVSIKGQPAITVEAGDVYTLNGISFWLIQIVSAVNYDAQIFGVKITTLKKMGIIKNAGLV